MRYRSFRVAFLISSLNAVLLVAAVGLVSPARAQDGSDSEAAIQAARSAATDWLEWVADEDFEDGWDEAAPSFRERIEREAWVKQGRRLVDSLGTPSARTLTNRTYRDSLARSAATGPFVLLTYRTTFSGAPFKEVLLLTPIEDEWAVAGYRVVPLRGTAPPVALSPRRDAGS